MPKVSIYILAPVLGWFFAHVVKFGLAFTKSGGKEMDWGIFFKAGGMPSSHSAVMIATLTVIGARQGVDSAIFGLGVAVTAVLIYDALNVRRSVGEQGDVLLKVARELKVGKSFFIAYGHTFTEVVGGIIVGLVVGLVLLQIL